MGSFRSGYAYYKFFIRLKKYIYERNSSETAFLGVSLLLRVVFHVLFLWGVVFESDILAKNFSCVLKNLYELNINKSSLLSVLPLLGVVINILLLLGMVFSPDLPVTNFWCYFKAHTWDHVSKKNCTRFLIFSQFSHFLTGCKTEGVQPLRSPNYP